MATHVKRERPDGEPLRRGYHMPGGVVPVLVYHARDIPADLNMQQRNALSWLLTGPKRPAFLAKLAGIERSKRRMMDSHISNMTLRVANLCEIESDTDGEGPSIGLVTRDGRGIIGV